MDKYRLDMQRILIVSDDIFLRELVALSLRGLGAELRSVADVADVARICARVEVEIDLVIVLGAGACVAGGELLPCLGTTLQRPVVYVISWQHTEQAVLGLLEYGADQYMTFPVCLARLRNKVSNELSRRA